MNSEAQRYERIQRYLLGQLQAEEQARFEAELQADPALRDEVERHRALHSLVEDAALADFQQQLQQVRDEKTKPSGQRPLSHRRRFWLLGGTLLAALLLLMPLLWQEAKQPQPVAEETTEVPPQASQPNAVLQPKPQPSATEPSVSAPNSEPQASQPTPSRIQPQPAQPAQENAAPAAKRPKAEPAPPALARKSGPLPVVKRGDTPSVSVENLPLPETDCSAFSPEVRYEAVPACPTQSDGQLRVLNVTGGQPPYRFSIDGGKSWFEGEEKNGLAAGEYRLLVRDAQGCTAEGPLVSIGEKTCAQAGQDYAFNPDRGERWRLPDSAQAFTLTVSDKTGRNVFTQRYAANADPAWEGRATDGARLPTGAYFYLLRYADGSTRKGTVSIVR